MKKVFAILISALMLFTCITVPVSAERVGATPNDAASLDEALNIPGGSLRFSTDTQYPWVVDGDAAKSSNEGVASSTSSVWINFTASAGDVIQFDWISMGEGSDAQDWDGLRVYLDGTKILHKSAGHPDWEHYQQEVAAGEHELKFTYKKDSSIDKEGDCAKIDNVHVGAPILPTSISVQPVTVIAGRSERAEFTVNPSYAYDKSVTYATADASIATVNANGGVFGVSEGTTTLTVTSAANPSVSGTATVTVLPSTGAAQLFGFCLDDVNGGALNGNLVSFFSDAPSVVTTETYFEKNTYSFAFAGGNIYGYVYDSNGSDTRFFVMNAETFEVTYPGTSYPAGMLAMAYNHANGTMYGISAHRNNNKLVSIDIATGYVT
ncbi:MAG: Ig domain-containing protein, partial [Clostridia bacterium]|nr:Ig domain-containing protein [Clostridia bacterium]